MREPSKLELKIRDAMSKRKISEMPQDELLMCIKKLINRTVMSLGVQAPQESFIEMLSVEVVEHLVDNYEKFSCAEVELCFSLGSKGQFGDFYGSNMRTFVAWLKAYKNSSDRHDAMDLNREKAAESDLEPRERILRGRPIHDYSREVFRAYKAGISLENFSPCLVYEHLQEIKAINDTDEEKRAAMDQITSEPVTILGVPLEGEAKKGVVAARAMRLLLERHFDRWIAEAEAKKQKEEAAKVKKPTLAA